MWIKGGTEGGTQAFQEEGQSARGLEGAPYRAGPDLPRSTLCAGLGFLWLQKLQQALGPWGAGELVRVAAELSCLLEPDRQGPCATAPWAL